MFYLLGSAIGTAVNEVGLITLVVMLFVRGLPMRVAVGLLGAAFASVVAFIRNQSVATELGFPPRTPVDAFSDFLLTALVFVFLALLVSAAAFIVNRLRQM